MNDMISDESGLESIQNSTSLRLWKRVIIDNHRHDLLQLSYLYNKSNHHYDLSYHSPLIHLDVMYGLVGTGFVKSGTYL